MEVKPIVRDIYDETDYYDSKYFVGDQFKFKSSDAHIDGDSEDAWMKFLQDESFDDASHNTWCQEFKKWQLLGSRRLYSLKLLFSSGIANCCNSWLLPLP